MIAALLNEVLLRLIRVIVAEPEPGPDFPSQWAMAMKVETPDFLDAIARRKVK